MGRLKLPVEYKDPIAAILGENIRKQLPRAFKHAKTETDQIEALHKRCGIAAETIRRIIVGKVSPRVNSLDILARAMGTHAWELLKSGDDAEIMSSPADKKTEPLQRRSG